MTVQLLVDARRNPAGPSGAPRGAPVTEHDLVKDLLLHPWEIPTPAAGSGSVRFEDSLWAAAAGTAWAAQLLRELPALARLVGFRTEQTQVAPLLDYLGHLSRSAGGHEGVDGPPVRESDPRTLLLRVRAALLGTPLSEREMSVARIRITPLFPATLAEVAHHLGCSRFEARRAELDVLARVRGPGVRPGRARPAMQP